MFSVKKQKYTLLAQRPNTTVHSAPPSTSVSNQTMPAKISEGKIHKKKSTKTKKKHKRASHHKKKSSKDSSDDPTHSSHIPGKKWKTEPDADGHHTHASRKHANAKAARAAIVASKRNESMLPQELSALRKQAITYNRRKFAKPEKNKRTRATGPRPLDLPPRLKQGFLYDVDKHESLYDVVRRGELKVIKKRITEKTNEINRHQGQYPRGTLLHVAAKHGSEEIVKHMLTNGADVHVQDDMGRTPLMVATRRGDVKIVKLLLTYDVKEKKKQLTARNVDDLTALQIAIQYGEEKIRSLYINHLKLEKMTMSGEDRSVAVALASHETEIRAVHVGQGKEKDEHKT